MDACIARGGISHVLSQARASLKNPSRPFTPQTSSRPLFHGDDYRPGSRPSSSYTVAELKQFDHQQTHQKLTPSVPKPTKLPPRPSGLKTRSPATPQPTEKTQSNGTAASGSLKLVHAPILSDDDESDDELSTADFGSADAQATAETQFDPEASLSLPSNDELVQSYDGVERCINELIDRAESPDCSAEVGRLRALVDGFVSLNSFLQTGSKQQEAEDDAAAQLRARLFDKLSRVLLERWSINAGCVLELAPSLLALYGATGAGSDDHGKASAQINKLGKTLFVLSKDSGNDSCFCNVRYVEAILHAIADTSDQASGRQDDKHSKDNDTAIVISAEQQKIPMKTLIYAAGTLKNISNAEDKMARLLATNRAIAILSETMLWRSEDAAKNKEIAQFVIQTTGILRNLSVSKSNHKQFLEAHIPQRLCGMIPAFIEHQELMVNISRILSKLTLHELPRAQINQRSTNVQYLVGLIDHQQNSWLSLVDQQRPDMRFQDLLFVRVFFVLGNLCAGNDQNRHLIASNLSGISIMLEVLQFYAARYSDARDAETVDDEKEMRRRAAEGEQAMEVLIKLVRVIANLAMNADVGAQLNGDNGITPLLEILEVAQRVGDEELMLNAVSCITNVSYYSTAPTADSKSTKAPSVQSCDFCFIDNNRVAITQLLSRILLDRNEEAVVEAARAFGNLSRFKDVLAYMGDLKVLDCLVVLLDHSNREVVYTVCGVLMNAALDHGTRQALLSVRPTVENDAVDVRSLLVGIVECAAADDLEMTLIASKALYNLLLSKDAAPNSGGDGVNFTSDAMKLRRTIEEVLGAISITERGGSKGASEPNEDGDEEASDSWSSQHELRLVLPQLLRSVNSVVNAQ
ncbi:Armadillo repeat-containing protein 2 [Phytophthora pseudosyringae]|uniref:Armadillo repeat-containing protein 2 n=1 Tax=Phytophthora pseudosyringae TaxID=221518 RepID=A0A8T1VU83_9STRA|nr:Armadillo repeat-containing protein 2 [Phytophthora pseudosyringae]